MSQNNYQGTKQKKLRHNGRKQQKHKAQQERETNSINTRKITRKQMK